MMNAYSELYIEDASCNLAEYLDYMTNWMKCNIDKAFEMFAYSYIGRQFEKGNPKYVAGMSGVEMALLVLQQVANCKDEVEYKADYDRSPQYWTGWAMAQYQWERNCAFSKMVERGLTASKVESNYILHEADITKFYDWADQIVGVEFREKENELNMLKRLRKYQRLTQKELSEKSGVTLRMIQLYEQGQNDLSKAQAGVVCSLAQALGTTVENLISPVMSQAI